MASPVVPIKLYAVNEMTSNDPERLETVEVLIVDGSLPQAAVFKDILSKSVTTRFAVRKTTTLAEATQTVADTHFDIILLALGLPDSMGLNTFYAIKKIAGSTPILILAPIEDEQLAVEAVRSGAQDYLVKSESDTNVLGRIIQCVIERDRLNRMQGELFNSVAHEIKTPLTIIKCAIDNLCDGIAGPTTNSAMKRMLSVVKNNTDRLSKVVKSIFAFKSMELRRKSKDETIDLPNIIHREIEKHQNQIHQKHIIMSENADLQLPSLHGNSTMISEVVNYILDNALRFANERVEIKITSHAKYVQVSIIDDGPGIPGENLKQLFQTFTQFNRSQEGPGYKGVGLGLVVCKEIIKKHNGRIWAETGSNGFVVNFTLPTSNKKRALKPTHL